MEEMPREHYVAGARNFYKFCGIKQGDHVLLLPTDEFLSCDPVTVEALREAGREINAVVSVAIIEAMGTRGNQPRPIARAIESSDAFLAMGENTPNPITGHNLTALRARWDYGAKQADLHGGKGILASDFSRFPIELFLAIGRSIMARLNKGKALEIMDDKGTRLRCTYDPSNIYGGASLETDHLEEGQRTSWPLGNVTILPDQAFSGVALVDLVRGLGPRIMENPARFVIENSRAVDIEEREETRKIKEELAKPENSDFVDKLIIGLNPKASIAKGLHRSRYGELCQAAGVTRIGIGDRPGFISSHYYTEGYLLKPTILLDGEVLFDRGRPTAMDDPEVRKVAGKYGDADNLLTLTP